MKSLYLTIKAKVTVYVKKDFIKHHLNNRDIHFYNALVAEDLMPFFFLLICLTTTTVVFLLSVTGL